MDTRSLTQLSIDEFLDRLASDSPTPGGGSAAALAGALAAALGRMACALTVSKPKFAAVEAQVRAAAQRLERAEQMLRRLIDEDAAAYAELSDAFELDRTNPQRPERVRQAATLAAEVPLETAAVCRRVSQELQDLQRAANPNLRSDVEAATHLAWAALHAAAANVRVNLPLLDPQAANVVREQLEALVQGRSASQGPCG